MRRFPCRYRCARRAAPIGFLSLFMPALSVSSSLGQDVIGDVQDARFQAEAGEFTGAFHRGVAALEAYPESDWDPATPRRFITEVAQRWHHRAAGVITAGVSTAGVTRLGSERI